MLELKVTILWSLWARSGLSEPLLCGACGNSCWRSPRKVKLTFTPLQWSKARGQMQIKRRRTDKSFKRSLMNVLVNAQLYGGGGGGVVASERVKMDDSLYAACCLIWLLFTGILGLLPPRTLLWRPGSEPSFTAWRTDCGALSQPLCA